MGAGGEGGGPPPQLLPLLPLPLSMPPGPCARAACTAAWHATDPLSPRLRSVRIDMRLFLEHMGPQLRKEVSARP